MLALQPVIKKVCGNGMLARTYFYTDKLAPSALQLHAQNGSRSNPEAACPPPSRNLSGKTMAKGAADGSGPLLSPHCLSVFSPGWLWWNSAVGSIQPGIRRGNWLQSIP